MPDQLAESAAALRRIVNGFQVSQALHVAATLGVADHLADGARSSEDLAAATGAEATTLHRVLRALAAAGVLHEDDTRRFSLTSLGEPLRRDVEGSIAGWAVQIGQPYYWEAWGNLLHSARTGENAFRAVNDTDVWSWRADHPDESAVFDQAMATMSALSTAAVLRAYDFSAFEQLVDVGGGSGSLLGAIVAATPGLRGVLVDLESVVSGAPDVLAGLGVADRVDIVAGNIFEAIPPGGDAYLMRAVLHDWADDDAVRILDRVREAMDETGTLLLVEVLIGGPNEAPVAAFSDLNMLVMTGGQERTEAEFASLFARAGFELRRTLPAGMAHVIEGVRRS